MKCCSLVCLLVCAISDPAVAQRVAIVTAGNGFLLDAADDVADTVPFYHVLDVTAEDGAFLKVQHGNRTLRIHRGLVHETRQLSYVNESDVGTVRQVFLKLQEAAQAAENDRLDDATEMTQQALQLVQKGGLQKTPLGPWVQQYEAWLAYAAGNYERAGQLLDICEATLQQTGSEQHFQAADVLNVRALIHEAEGRYAEAIALFQQSLSIQLKKLGADHHDSAVLRMNLSSAYESASDLKQAILFQKLALKTQQKILPENAIELAEGFDRLGDLLRVNEQHEQAAAQYKLAIDLYQRHHPDRHVSLAEIRADVVYVLTQLADFDGAENMCRVLLDSLSGLPPEDALYFRKDTLTRQGTIDYVQEKYQDALAHYQQAVQLADPNSYRFEDGTAQESVGAALQQLQRTEEARAAYEQAIRIYAQTDGADSETVLNLRTYVDDLDSFRHDSLGDVVQVAMPRAYLLNEDGSVMTAVPGLTVLEWYSSNDEFHEVMYDNQLGRLPNDQLHRGRLIPGYGVTKASVFKAIMTPVSEALRSLQQGDHSAAETELQTALQLCIKDPGQKNSLYLWLKVIEAGVHLRTRGADHALKDLQNLEPELQALNPDAYPLSIEVHNARSAIWLETGDAAAAVKELQAARAAAVARYSEGHAVVRELTRTLGKALYRAGDHPQAVTELRDALRLSEQIYPPGTPEISELISELGLALTESGQLKEAATLLEEILSKDHQLPREIHAMTVATLGKVYAGLNRTNDARQLLSTVVKVLNGAGDDAINVPAGLLACSELGRLELAQKNWQEAADHFRQAMQVADALQVGDTFEASEIQRQRAEALYELGDAENAVSALNDVLRIYDVLGGGDSPQADDIRARLKTMMNSTPTAEGDASHRLQLLARYFDLTPDGEQMFVTVMECPVTETSEATGELIDRLPEDTRVWSLAEENNHVRCYLSKQQRFGWIHRTHLTPADQVLVTKGRDKLSEVLKNKPPEALEACLQAFDRARPEGGFDDPQEGIAVIEESIATIRSHYAYSNPLSALLYEDLMNLCQQTGDTATLTTAAQNALTHFTAAHGFDHPATATVRSIRASHHQAMGQFFEEASELEEVLKTCEKRFGPNDDRTNVQRLGLAANLVRRGFFDRARAIYDGLLPERDGTSPELVQAVARLGRAALDVSVGNDAAAAVLLRSAADDFSALGNPAPSLMARTLATQAYSRAKAGEKHEAFLLLETAEQLPLAPTDHSLRLLILTLKARVAAGSGAAVDLAETAVGFATQTFGPEHFYLHDPLHQQALILAETEPRRAAEVFERSRRLFHRHLNDRVRFQRNDLTISLLTSDQAALNEALTLGLQDGDPATAEATATWLINGHRLLPEILAFPRRAMAGITQTSDQQNFIIWQSRRNDSANVPLEVRYAAAEPYLQQAFRDLQKEEQQAFDRLPAEIRTALNQETDWITCNELRGRLRPDEVLILFRRLPEPLLPGDPTTDHLPPELRATLYAAWMIPPAGKGSVRVVPLGLDRRIDTAIDQTMEHILVAAGEPLRIASRSGFANEERHLLTELGRLVWQPIAAELPAGAQRLTLCPDGDLHHIPWIALPDAEGQPLIDSFTIRQVSTPRDVIRTHDAQLAQSAPVLMYGALSVGKDPDLAGQSRDALQFLSRRTKGTRFDQERDALRDSLGIETFLPAGIDEAEALEDDFKRAFGGQLRKFEGEFASEFGFLSAKRPRAMHLAAIPFVAGVEHRPHVDDFSLTDTRMLIQAGTGARFNPLLGSGLLLSGFGRSDSPHPLTDGFLTGEEIVSQDLRGTELVTLSLAPASHDSFGELHETVAMLPHAFQLAGAKTVVSCGWATEEETQVSLLKTFYQQLAAGKDASTALRAAQLQVRDQMIAERRVAPAAVWAAYRLTGAGWHAAGATD
ncbi:MAG: tetratricopeptide repeat protein [Fuerstiella sp.]